MHYRPSPLVLSLILLTLLGLVIAVHVGIIAFSFEHLGLQADSALQLALAALFGSLINLPVARLHSRTSQLVTLRLRHGLLRLARQPNPAVTLIAVNLGGCLIPLGFCVYLLTQFPIAVPHLLFGVGAVAAISYWFSRPIPGIGIGMPFLIGPLTAALISITLEDEYRAPLAYCSGVLGVLIGADLLRLKDIRRMGGTIASIGGAGTFDGIFMTGLLAALLT